MAWRGSTTPLDRFLSCLPYLLPLLLSLQFSVPFSQQFPILIPFMNLLLQLAPLTNGILGMVLFLALFLLVVRNESISHFIRFNTMQAILLNIGLFLCIIILSLLQPLLQGELLRETIDYVIFLGTLVAVIYSVVQSALGRYAEIPTLSDAVYMQVR